jgi:hypothetical protein
MPVSLHWTGSWSGVVRPSDAVEALRPLVAATQGWTEEALTLYVDQLSKLNNPRLLAEAALMVARDWSSGRRPGLYDILNAYRALARRQELAAPPPAIGAGRMPSFHEGITIARWHYAQERKLHGHEPNYDMFAKWVGGI